MVPSSLGCGFNPSYWLQSEGLIRREIETLTRKNLSTTQVRSNIIQRDVLLASSGAKVVVDLGHTQVYQASCQYGVYSGYQAWFEAWMTGYDWRQGVKDKNKGE